MDFSSQNYFKIFDANQRSEISAQINFSERNFINQVGSRNSRDEAPVLNETELIKADQVGQFSLKLSIF